MFQAGAEADAVWRAGQDSHGNAAFCFQIIAFKILRRFDFRQSVLDQLAAPHLQFAVIKAGYGLFA